jgi:hypothetical protein
MLQQLAVRSDQSLELREATSAAGDFARASKAGATIKAYQADAADFAAWCSRRGTEALPATVDNRCRVSRFARPGRTEGFHDYAPMRWHPIYAPHGRP